MSQTIVKCKILDEETKLPIAGATVLVTGTGTGSNTSSDSFGQFTISRDTSKTLSLSIEALGYFTLTADIQPGDTSKTYLLESKRNQIETVDIVRKRKYTNKNNPAVELIDLVIRHKSKNRLSRKDSLYFEQYDKVKFGMVDPKEGFSTKLGPLNFFFENIDTVSRKGKELLTLYMEENLSDNYAQQNPARSKKIIKAQHKTEFDARYINNANIQSYMNYLFQPVDIYDESIFFLNKQFLSPIADNGKLFYKYYIIDTVRTPRELYIRLAFEPRNPKDLLLKGELQVSLDGKYAVKEASLSIGKSANINWVNEFDIRLDYSPNEEGIMLIDTAHVQVIFGLGNSDALFGERMSYNSKYDLSHPIPENTFTGAPLETRLDPMLSLKNSRPIALNRFEEKTYSNVDSINNVKTFKALLATGYLLSQSYYSLGKVELGPVEYLFHQNNWEGNRFRIGGRTTAGLSEKFYLEGYLAYGTRDEQLKYYMKSAFSLNGKSVATFPAHYIEMSYQHDIFDPGRALGFLKGDSFFQGFRANKPLKWLATDAYRVGHVIEFANHISFATSLTHQRRNPLGDLRFPLSADSNQFLDQIYTNDVQLTLRWAPFEKFYYRNLRRQTIVEKYPVFTLQYNKGIEGFWDAAYNYDALRLSASKRLFLNQIGFGDLTVSAGKIWGNLPYILLEMPNVQEVKDRHSISYELTNNMEFVADQFLKFSYDHELQGFIFNKIPLLKKLKLREIFGAQMFYGKLSSGNNPYSSSRVVHFDLDEDGNKLTHVLGKDPYWEGYVGIDNILKVVRVQYMRRFNYLHNPNLTKERFRVSLNFNF